MAARGVRCSARLLLAALALGASLAPWAARPARAADATGQVIPYDGLLKLDGTPVDGPLAMRFTLFDPEGTALWTEERSDEDGRSCTDACQVTFYRGRFSVLLGEHATLPDTVWAERSLLLGVAVRRSDGTWIELSGRQAIVPAPYALWSAGAASLDVTGTLTVEGDLTADGTLTVWDAALRSAGALAVGGALDAGTLDVAGTVTAAGGATITGDLTVGGDAAGADMRLRFLPHDTYGGAATAISATADTVILNQDAQFSAVALQGDDNDIDFDGDLTVGGWIELDDDAAFSAGGSSVSATRGLFVLKYIDMGSALTADTGIPTSQYNCWIGGVAFLGGDINEGSTVDIMSLYVYKPDGQYSTSGNWYVKADFASHSDEHETHEVVVFCVQKSSFSGYDNVGTSVFTN